MDRDLVGTLSISTPRRSLLSTDSFSPPSSPEGGSDSRFIFYRSAKERKKAKWRLAKFNDLNLAQIPSLLTPFSLFSFFCSISKFTEQNSKKTGFRQGKNCDKGEGSLVDSLESDE